MTVWGVVHVDPQTPEAPRERVAALKRRLLLAVAGLLVVMVSLVVGVLAQNVRAQPSLVRAAAGEVTKADLDAIQSQVNELQSQGNEFRAELGAYGIRLTAVEEELHARTPAPTDQVTAQGPGGYWTVITTKMQIVEGRGVMQVMGPFPSAAMCDVTLNGILGGLREQGIAVESSACRKNVAIVVPK